MPSPVDAWFAALNAHDVDALVEVADPAIVAVPAPDSFFGPRGAVFHGHAGLRSLFGLGFERFPRLRATTREFESLSADTTAVTVDLLLDERAERRVITVLTIGRGLIRAVRYFTSAADVHAHVACDPLLELTEREREILRLLACGLTAEAVAERLVVSPLTVRTHTANLREKLRARNVAHAVAIAASNQIPYVDLSKSDPGAPAEPAGRIGCSAGEPFA